jgi:hypothetical protein
MPSDRLRQGSEISIAMLQSGAEAVRSYDPDLTTAAEVAREVYLAMERERIGALPTPRAR